MRNRRLAIAGLALVAAVGLAGCGPTGTSTTSGSGAPAGSAAATGAAAGLTPEKELAAAATKLGEQSMRIDMDMAGAMSMSGKADPKTGLAEMSMTLGALGDTKVELRKVGDDLFMKFGGGMGKSLTKDSAKPWMHLDASKIADGSSFNILPKDDPGGAKAMLAAMTGVQKTGDRAFKGTLDLTKMPQYQKRGLDALGDKATKVPFTATADAEGRLTEMTMDMSGLGAGSGKVKTTYSDFGTPVDVEAPPASQVGELPKELSGLVNA